ncbi:hypothetical protein A2291_08205 [candidate division WOR-1 bacterium RIFOXYB2_FULL_42_35]|nr:MAG: hypothetical protein A2291_08205 [candidate division WOR-1 bacterium RIFOXYB2_FULL_42_35]
MKKEQKDVTIKYKRPELLGLVAAPAVGEACVSNGASAEPECTSQGSSANPDCATYGNTATGDCITVGGSAFNCITNGTTTS